MKHLNQRIRVPIDKDNPSIQRIEDKCIKCGNCAKVCSEYCSVLSEYKIEHTKRGVCVNCGQCIMTCPVDSIVEKSSVYQVKSAIKNHKIVIVSTSPACRVSLGEAFGLKPGSLVEGKMVGLLKELGFTHVLDTNFGADVTIIEEANELLERLNNNKLPMFSSCCPAWVKFVETFYPELITNLSSCRSPIGMQGALIKTYFARKMGIEPTDIVNVCLTPCVAKKMEILRPEQNKSSVVNDSPMRDMDYCITTREVAEWAKDEGIDFNSLNDGEFDRYMSTSSGSGAIFGKSGGVAEAVTRCLLEDKDKIRFKKTKSNPAIKTAKVEYKGNKLKIASVYGLNSVRQLLDEIKNGKSYDFVEVMACPGGCIGGGGQPKTNLQILADESRRRGINKKDEKSKVLCPQDNPEIKALYKDYLKNPNSKLCKELLHTTFVDRSDVLKTKRKTEKLLYKCQICGNVFEVKSGVQPTCLKCGETKFIDLLD